MNPQSSILIVDDTPENLTVLRDILARAGYRVRPVLQGALALKSAAADPPDLILLDIMMPGMDGYQTCQELKANERTADIPVLFISALDGTENKVRGFGVGGLDYITKPFRAEEVLARVGAHIALQNARRQLKGQNEELLRAAALREDVDRMLRHDLRGSLNNIIGYSELLAESLDSNDESASCARVIVGAGYSMLGMIHSSFDLMKMERGIYEGDPGPFDVVEPARQVLGELALEAEKKEVTFSLSFADPEAEDMIVLGERLLTRSLLHNLVKNAVEASPDGESVELFFRRSDAGAEIQLRNAGEVPELIRARFFDKFVTCGKLDGTGLGTYSARLMTEAQGGRIRLDASEAGHTSIFVTLPSASASQAAEFRAARAREQDARSTRFRPSELPGANLLIADDDAANRAYLRRVLPSPPLTLSFATNGEEALAALKEQDFAAALIDLEMPVMNGLEAAQLYREWRRSEGASGCPNPILIAFSSHQDSATREKCLAAGFDRILGKPATKDKLLEELKQALPQPSTVVRLDPEIKDLIPEYLELQHAQIHQLDAAINEGDCSRTLSLSHRLQGSFAMYGLQMASQISTAIEEAAKVDNLPRSRLLVGDLRAHLASLEFRFT